MVLQKAQGIETSSYSKTDSWKDILIDNKDKDKQRQNIWKNCNEHTQKKEKTS